MEARAPFAARNRRFYPADAAACRDLLRQVLEQGVTVPVSPGPFVAGIVPHAGWVFSGPTAAKVYNAMKRSQDVDTFVLFGADHYGAVPVGGVDSHQIWQTPTGDVPVDLDLARTLLERIPGILMASGSAHIQEHSLEVQVPLIHELYPRAMICPILVPPFPRAAELGRRVFQALASAPRRVVAIGSTDLTHYGPSYTFTPRDSLADPLAWAREVNDKGMLDLIRTVDADPVLDEYHRNRNACGPGAIAATLGFARAAGAASGEILEHVYSCEVMPQAGKSDFVGYVGAVFENG